MARFDPAFAYVLENEGGDSDHPLDHGGKTRFGITAHVAKAHGRNIETLTLDDAKEIYREGYWRFDQLFSQAVATKLFDIAVNIGLPGATRLVQRCVGVKDDGVFGPQTRDAINQQFPEPLIHNLSRAVAEYYVTICQRNPAQLAFLLGWIRRAFRRPSNIPEAA